MKPLVSVIIPTYNRGHVLKRAIDSVLGQTFKNFEILVINDGSTDGTDKILEEYQYVRVTNSSQMGVSHARNLGIRQSKGKWICFLDSDDEWLPEKLALQLRKATLEPQSPLIHGDEIWIRNGVRVNPMKKHQKKGGDVFEDALKLCCISPSTVMIRKDLFDEVGFFREDFPVCEDYDLWLKITARYSVAYVDDFLIRKFGGHADQLSRQYKAMDYWRVLALAEIIQVGGLDPVKLMKAQYEFDVKANILMKGYRKHQNLVKFDQVYRLHKRVMNSAGPSQFSDIAQVPRFEEVVQQHVF